MLSRSEETGTGCNQGTWGEQVLSLKKRQILGVDIAVLNRSDASSFLQSALRAGRELKVAFANAHMLNVAVADPSYKMALKDFLVFNDGIGVDLASWMKFGRFFPENLNGTDFVPFFLSSARELLRLYLLGSSSVVAKVTADRFSEYWPRHRVVGWRSGFFNESSEGEVACEAIRAAKPDVVLVGMGNPVQELWISRYAEATGARDPELGWGRSSISLPERFSVLRHLCGGCDVSGPTGWLRNPTGSPGAISSETRTFCCEPTATDFIWRRCDCLGWPRCDGA